MVNMIPCTILGICEVLNLVLRVLSGRRGLCLKSKACHTCDYILMNMEVTKVDQESTTCWNPQTKKRELGKKDMDERKVIHVAQDANVHRSMKIDF